MTASFYSFPIDTEIGLDLAANACIFARTETNSELWGRAVHGDFVLFAIKSNPIKIYCGKIIGKGLFKPSSGTQKRTASYIAYVENLHRGYIHTLAAYSISILTGAAEISENEYNRFRALCSPLEYADRALAEDVFPFAPNRDVKISLAQTSDDVRFIHDLAALHPFGEAHGPLTLVMKERGQRVAGAIIRFGEASSKTHSAEHRIFQRNLYALKRYSVHVSRLYSIRINHRRQQDFKHLLRCIAYFVDFLFDKPATYISGASYQYIPAAIAAGYLVDIPIESSRALFYYKPLFISGMPDSQNIIDIKQAYRQIRLGRRKNRFWLIPAKHAHIELIIRRQIWPMADSPLNFARWRSLKSGDVVMISSELATVNALATVGGIRRERIPGFERYPLVVALNDIRRPAQPIGIRDETVKPWFSAMRGGGIYEIPEEFALSLIDNFVELERKYKMWVTPNPFLLKRRQFQPIRGTIFVVQSWSLKDTVLPIVKEICRRENFSVTHSEDRQGQVVFEDIWILINECEAVIVDFTEKRPNVYLEFGMALVLGKPVIAITQNETDLPSDTPNLKYLKYRGDINASLDLGKHLPKALADTIGDFARAADEDRMKR